MENKFRKGCKLAWKYYVNLQCESECFEKGYEMLMEKLKKEIFTCFFLEWWVRAFKRRRCARKSWSGIFLDIIDEDTDKSEEESESDESKDEIEDE